MNSDVLNTVNQDFINKYLDYDISSLLLKKHHNITVDIRLLIEQIESKKRCKNKLSTWFVTENIYYPNKLNIEQTSSEITAKYKSELVSGRSIIDITGGFGVDCYYFSSRFNNIIHCEIDEELHNIVKHNYKKLKSNNINCILSDGIEYLKINDDSYDWIYIDPSRRHDTKGKIFFLEDCTPNVPENLDLIFRRSRNILVKTSPLLDLTVGINELKHVKSIHVVAVNNEVKELLWILEKNNKDNIKIETVNIKPNKTELFEFIFNEEKKANATVSEPLSYLYEPNAAILKSGAFRSVSSQLNVLKLHPNTHLYTLDKLIDFPGRRFKIEKVLPYNKKLLKKEFIYKANVAIRNFPESVDQIRRKLNIRDGGKNFLFVTTSSTTNKVIIICSKID